MNDDDVMIDKDVDYNKNGTRDEGEEAVDNDSRGGNDDDDSPKKHIRKKKDKQQMQLNAKNSTVKWKLQEAELLEAMSAPGRSKC